MWWNELSAIGTILAAFVGIIGIWINYRDKTRRLHTYFKMVPNFKIYLSNNSLRTIMVTKMICFIGEQVVHVEYFEGLKELALPPSTTQTIDINKEDICRDYCKMNMCALCNSTDKTKFVIYDNYGRKYTVKTDLNISDFQI